MGRPGQPGRAVAGDAVRLCEGPARLLQSVQQAGTLQSDRKVKWVRAAPFKWGDN